MGKTVEFTEIELYQIGLGRFCQTEENLREVILGDSVESVGKGSSVEFEFFCQMMKLGWETIYEKIKQKS
jgi:hypothetical protein